MANTVRKKTLSVLLVIAVMLSLLSVLAISAGAESSVTGIWNGSTTAANGTVYSLALELSANGDYTLVTSYTMGEDVYHEKENGTYTVEGSIINFIGDKLIVEAMESTFDASNTAGTIDGTTMTITRHASFMAKSMGKDPVDITLTKGETPASTVYGDTLISGTYELTADSYDPSAGMKLAADIIIDTNAKTFELWRTMASGEYTKRSEGTISFDETTGVYTIAFTTPADKSTTFTFNLIDSGITFTSPLYFGAVAMNVTDDNGNFLPYTAYPKAADKYDDTLVSGTYELTAESYDASAAMKMAADIIIDTNAKTFELWRTMASGEYTKRSEGTISFDETTGVYTIAFTTPADKSTTFTYDAETKGITFTSPLYFGTVAMNVTDDNGNFLSYTAYPKANDNPSENPEQVNYLILDGADGTVAQGAGNEYRIRCSGPLDKFAALYIDNELVDEKNYQKSEGSTVITLSGDYMKTLSAGQHTVKLVYTNGSVETTLTVRSVDSGVVSPQTGDNSHIELWFILMFISLAGIVGLAVYGKKSKLFSK